jgi:hypothetical protein
VIENKLRSNEGTERELNGLELIVLLLGALLSSTVDGVIGEKFEGIGIRIETLKALNILCIITLYSFYHMI